MRPPERELRVARDAAPEVVDAEEEREDGRAGHDGPAGRSARRQLGDGCGQGCEGDEAAGGEVRRVRPPEGVRDLKRREEAERAEEAPTEGAAPQSHRRREPNQQNGDHVPGEEAAGVAADRDRQASRPAGRDEVVEDPVEATPIGRQPERHVGREPYEAQCAEGERLPARTEEERREREHRHRRGLGPEEPGEAGDEAGGDEARGAPAPQSATRARARRARAPVPRGRCRT